MKKINLLLNDIFNVPGAEIINPDEFLPVTEVTTDSRKITGGCLFTAIKGENFDGHDFVEDAVLKGAGCVMVNSDAVEKLPELEIPVIAVPDTIKAYGTLAGIWRSKLEIPVISLTGSNGKTSTKEIISSILAVKYNVSKTLANNNNHLGVPLTIFSTNAEHTALVLEQGTNHFGEIEYTAEISRPDFALITNIGDSHLEFLVDRAGVLKEKGSLLEITARENGKIFINTDDPLLNDFLPDYKSRITYGFEGTPDVKGKLEGIDNEGKTILGISSVKAEFTLRLPVYGTANAKNTLAAAAVCLEAGLTPDEIILGVNNIKAVYGRMNVINCGNFRLVDDTYNSNPDSVKAGVDFLNSFSLYGNKVLILGDMFEMGEQAERVHRGLASVIKESSVSLTLLLGENMKYLNDELAGSEKNIKWFETRDKMGSFLKGINTADSVIFVKGSRGMKMEEFLEILKQKAK